MDDLKQRNLIRAGVREGRATTELLITETGIAAIANAMKVRP